MKIGIGKMYESSCDKMSLTEKPPKPEKLLKTNGRKPDFSRPNLRTY